MVLTVVYCVHVVLAPASTADKVVSAGRRPKCPVSAEKGTCITGSSLRADWIVPLVRSSMRKKPKLTELVPAADHGQSIRIGFGSELGVEGLGKRHSKDCATAESMPSLIDRLCYLKRKDNKLRSALSQLQVIWKFPYNLSVPATVFASCNSPSLCRRPVRQFGVTCVPANQSKRAAHQHAVLAACIVYVYCPGTNWPLGANRQSSVLVNSVRPNTLPT